MKFKQLINPHSHSHHSLDGAATVKQIVKRNKALGATHVVLTEHGNMNSAMELYTSAREEGVKPILGIEAYVEHPFKDFLRQVYESQIKDEDIVKREKKIQKKLAESYVHVTIHFKDEWAYKYFCSLTPAAEQRAIVKWGESKAMLTWEEIAKAKGHITMGSSCLIGPVQSMVHTRWKSVHPDMAEMAYQMMRDLVGPENFFVEIFPHRLTHDWKRPQYDKESGRLLEPGRFEPAGCNHLVQDGDIQRFTNEFMMNLAKKYGDKVLISLDSHFATKEQKVTQDARLGNGDENWKFHNSYHVMDTNECAEELKATLKMSDRDIEELVSNSYEFASHFDNFKIATNKDRWVLTSLPEDWLGQLKGMIDRHGRMDWNDRAMVDQLKFELDVIARNGKMNLMSYLFVVEDMANFCRENEILMNVRGSAGGALLFYVLGVSAVNPLKHNLSFGRFLTPGRIRANTLPDADLDISTDGRKRLIEYLEKKYGDGFCRISTDGMLKMKSSIKDAERAVLGSVRPETEAMCKALPAEPQGVNSKEFVFGKTAKDGTYIPGLLDSNDALKAYAAANPQVWSLVTEMLGIMRQKGSHACGVVIAEEPIQNLCPIMYLDDTRLTGFSPKSVEAAGLVKYDLLGLNTLQDIELCLKSIKDRLQLVVNPWAIPEEIDVYEELWKGNTVGVFQFDTDTVRPYLVDIRPKSRDDLAAITSLCRPGCLDAPHTDGRTLAQVYVARANGEPIEYVHQDLEEIFRETNGIALYQEQTISIFKKLANYSDEQAETVRRGIGKKEEAVLASCMADLKAGCLRRGWTEQQVQLLVDQIMASARYSFNKSHAVSYAYVAYACAWLKKRYPLDWWKAVLSNASKDEIASKFWAHAQKFTDLPDINLSGDDFRIVNDRLVAPLSIVSGIGEKAFAQLVKHAPYASLFEYVQVHHAKRDKDSERSAVNIGVSRKLVASGVMDSIFGPYAKAPVDQKLRILERAKAMIRQEKEDDLGVFEGITPLGIYLIKKELINIYSEDVRSLVLGNRGARIENGRWVLQNNVQVIDGNEFETIKGQVERGTLGDGYYAMIAYVVKERTFTYKGKSKQASELILDVNGKFFKEVLWPPYQGNVAASGFNKQLVVVYIKIRRDRNGKGRIGVDSVAKLIDDKDAGKYNIY